MVVLVVIRYGMLVVAELTRKLQTEQGDVIGAGPRTALTATQTLKPKMPIAGGETVRSTPA